MAGEAIDALGGRVVSEDQAGVRLWSATERPVAGEPAPVLLLPLYDEMLLTYGQFGFPAATGHPHPEGVDLFVGSVIARGQNLGLWRRTIKGSRVEVWFDLAPGATTTQRAAAERAAGDLAVFLGLELVLLPP